MAHRTSGRGAVWQIAWFDKVLELVAWLVAAVATGSVLASIYNSMNERRRDIAILRALGARAHHLPRRRAGVRGHRGAGDGRGVRGPISASRAWRRIIRTETGVVLNAFAWHPILAWAPAAMIGLSALAGVIPAVKAYRTNVAENLVPVS